MSVTRYSFLAGMAGERLDRFVAVNCPDVSRSQAQHLIDDGLIVVNGRRAKPAMKLDTGDRVEVSLPSPSRLVPEALPLEIIYQDDSVVVVDKPAGMTVHPAPGHNCHTLVNVLLSYFPELGDSGSLRPGIVHRLDRDASGVMVVARNVPAQLDLIEQFRKRYVKKEYLVLVTGRLGPDRGVVEAPIGRDPHNRKRMAVVDTVEGRAACTHYSVIRHMKEYTLLEVRPETGRTHQIRVHLSAIGYPVLGDRVYGSKSELLPRLFLHAFCLGFTLPDTGKYVEFTSGLPSELEEALESLG